MHLAHRGVSSCRSSVIWKAQVEGVPSRCSIICLKESVSSSVHHMFRNNRKKTPRVLTSDNQEMQTCSSSMNDSWCPCTVVLSHLAQGECFAGMLYHQEGTFL